MICMHNILLPETTTSESQEALGLQVETAEDTWVRWRSLYVTDPEGNQVELVCYDSGV